MGSQRKEAEEWKSSVKENGIEKDVMGIKRGVGMIRCIQSGNRSKKVDERRLGDGDLNKLEDLNIALAESEEFTLSFSNSKKNK